MKIYFYLSLFVATLLSKAPKTLALSLQDFRNSVFRPDNLPGGETGNISAEGKVVGILDFFITLILYASGSVAVLMLVYGGVRLVTATGNEEQKDQAVKIIRNALIGLLVVILAFALVTNIINVIYQATT